MVVELAYQIVASAKAGPAKERVRLQLHCTLPVGYALPVVAWRVCIRQVRRIARERLFFDLQKQRIAGAITFKVNAVVTQPYRAGAYHFEGHIYGPVKRQQMLPLRFQHLAVRCKRSQHGLGLCAGDTGQRRLDLLEVPLCAAGRRILCRFFGQRAEVRDLGQLLERVVAWPVRPSPAHRE